MGDVGGHPSQTLSAEESTVFYSEVQEICLRKFTGGELLYLIVMNQRMAQTNEYRMNTNEYIAQTQDSFNKVQFDLLGRVSVSINQQQLGVSF